MANTTMMAFSKASMVMMSRGMMPRSSMPWTAAAAWCAIPSLLGSMAGTEAAPGMDMPKASMAEDMVLAVNMPAQAPSPGQAMRSMAKSSSNVRLPLEWDPTASNMS